MNLPRSAVAGSVLALTAAACTSTAPHSPEGRHTPTVAIANPNYLPQLRGKLGGIFLKLYNHASPSNRHTPFESGGRVTVAEVDVPIGGQVLKFTINQLTSNGINPGGITSLDILRFNPAKPMAGFDMHFGYNPDGTVDASCSSYQAPHGFSETHQNRLFAANGSPMPQIDKLADAFLSDELTSAGQYGELALHPYAKDRASLTLMFENPCNTQFGN